MIKRTKEEVKLPTSDDILQDALGDYLRNIEMPLTNSGNNILILTEDNKDTIIALQRKLIEALACGKGDAAYYLAQFYYNGWLVTKDIPIGDFILTIGKNLDSIKCFNTSYKNAEPPSDNLKRLALACTYSIQNTKTIYNKALYSGISDIIKKSAVSALIKHLENTDLKDIFGTTEVLISTVSSPLLSIKHQTIDQNLPRRATQSDIKNLTSDEDKNNKYYKQAANIREIQIEKNNNPNVNDEQTELIGSKHDGNGCTCLII